MQVVPGPLRHQRQARVLGVAPAPVQVPGQLFQQLVQGALADDAQLAMVQAVKGRAGGPGQARIAGQGTAECQLGIGRRLGEQRPQFALQPLRVEVQHAVGKAALGGGLAVVDFPRFQQEHLARRALVPGPAAVELLHPLLGDAHQVAVVPVRVIGVAGEMGPQGLDAGVGILGQVDPVGRGHGAVRGAWRQPWQLTPVPGLGSRSFVQPQLNSPAAILIEKPRIAVLNRKPISDWARTILRSSRVATPTSEVCTATPMVKEKYRKSQ